MALTNEDLQQLSSQFETRLDKHRADLEFHIDQRLSIRLHQHQATVMADMQSLLQQELQDIRTILKQNQKT